MIITCLKDKERLRAFFYYCAGNDEVRNNCIGGFAFGTYKIYNMYKV